MPGKGKNLLAPLSDADALAVMRGAVSVYNSPDCPIKSIPEQFEQPTDVLKTYDAFKASCEAAHPNERRQDTNERAAQRKVFNERMGNFVDTVEVASRKAPDLLSIFGFEMLFQNKPAVPTKSWRNQVPKLAVQAIDKEQGTINCKVIGGVKKGIEIQHAYEDPTNEANWLHSDAFVNAIFSMTGFTSGRRAYLRGRYIFSKGKKGPWSEMVSIMVP